MNAEQWWAVVSSLEEVKALVASGQGLEAVRGAMRGQLTQARRVLCEAMPELEAFKVLFPVVLYCDELMLRRLPPKDQTLWLPLQTELYKIDDGGEALYRLLDEELDKPDMLPDLAAVHYYCLNDGFVGRYSEAPLKIQEYKDRLATKIQTRAARLAAREGRDGERAPRQKGEGRRKRSARAGAKKARASAVASAEPAAAPGDPAARRAQAAGSPLWGYYVGAAALGVALLLLLLWIFTR